MKIVKSLVATLALAAVAQLPAMDFSEYSDLDFAERYAYSTNRTELIGELKRETEPWYFYTLLNRQVEGHCGVRKSADLGRFSESDAWNALKLRDMFLGWSDSLSKPRSGGRTPDEFLAFELSMAGVGLEEPHAVREVAVAPNTHPSTLDPAKISYDGFCAYLARRGLILKQRYEFLPLSGEAAGMRRDPDMKERPPNTPGILDDAEACFRMYNGGCYNTYEVTKSLTLEQLLELRRRGIAVNDGWIWDVLERLEPNSGEDFENDPAAMRAWLDRDYDFTMTLGDDQEKRKVEAMERILEFERGRGNFAERELFAAYLGLTRKRAHPAGLIEDYLAAYRRQGDDFAAFKDLVPGDDLKRIAAATDLLSGVDRSKVDLKALSDREFQALRDRVEITWCASNPKRFAAEDEVTLELDVKNVKKLRVAVYELDAFRAMVQLGGEIRSDLDLDGCVPGEEETRDYSAIPAIVRHREQLSLKSLAKPGIYVVECSGGGVSSRAVIRKGTLGVGERVESCGHVFTVLDERGVPVKSARLRLGETTYQSDESGEIVVPFAAPQLAGEQLAIVGANGLAAVHRFDRRRESYGLNLRVCLPPEQVVAGQMATAVLSARLFAADWPASIGILTNSTLTVTLTDLGGVKSVRQIENPRFSDAGEFAYRFVVPPRLKSVCFELGGKVRNLSMARDDAISDSCEIGFNGICRNNRIEQAFLRRNADGYSLELRGRNGEPLVAREVQAVFSHRVFRDGVQVALQTDEHGVIRLGALKDIDQLELVAPFDATWNLAEDDAVRIPNSVTLQEDDTWQLRLPGMLGGAWPMATNVNAAVSLMAVNRRNVVTHDLTPLVVFDGDVLTVGGLKRGDYRLYLRRLDLTIDLHVVKCVSPHIAAAKPLLIADAQLSDDVRKVTVRLGNSTPAARVHLVAQRYVPLATADDSDLFAMLSQSLVYSSALEIPLSHPTSDYISGRDLGDKLRYILDRRNQPHRPGNMLERPSLLLNPWSVSETRTNEQNVRGGASWRANASDREAMSPNPMRAKGERRCKSCADYVPPLAPTYDFLVGGARVWCNLRPDADGIVTFELPEGLDHGDFAVVATDGISTDCRRLAAAQRPTAMRDLRHRADAADASQLRSRTYADLRSAYQFICANAMVDHLDQFEFVTRWPSLAAERQRELYGEFACHELDVFLYFRDRAFFDAVIAPALANKRQKDFVDCWLLGEDLGRWMSPAGWQDLNAFERCLLAKREPSVAARIAAQLDDWCKAHPTSPEALDAQLRAALGLGDESNGIAELACCVAPVAPDVDSNLCEENSKPPMTMGVASGQRLGKAAKRRDSIRQTYRPPESTREWVETGYYRRRKFEKVSILVSNGRFWRDWAAAIAAGGKAPFLPQSFSEMASARSLEEALGALAILDLPFEAKAGGDKVPQLVYTELSAKGVDKGVRELAVISRILDRGNTLEDGETGYESEEFVAGRVYELQTVVSNPTERRLRIALSSQIPEGAIALDGGRASECVSRYVEPYSSVRHWVSFYFPTAGEDVGALAPVSVAVGGEMRGVGEAFRCNVVAKSTREDRTSWRWISQNGTEDQVIGFLSTNNLAARNVELAKIGWRMGNDAFARRVYDTLSARGVFDEQLWKFALFGRYRISDFRKEVRELLMSKGVLVRLAPKLGPSFHCSIVDVEPEETDLFEYAEFWPLINARAHTLGGTATIANESLKRHYRQFLDYLATKSEPSAGDRLDAAVYLIAQDRVDEAERMVADVTPADVETKLQLAYLRAYFAFSNLEPEKGREIAAEYTDWPVKRWRERFRKVIAQADEIAGRTPAFAAAEADEAAEAPSLELAAESSGGIVNVIVVRSRNVTDCTLRAYRTDVEMTFSKDPFGASAVKSASSLLKPAYETTFATESGGVTKVQVPPALRGSNLLVEVTDGEGRVTATLSVLSGSLDVQVASEYGELRVRDRNGRPLAAAYVKVYAQDESGKVEKFHKDGYTDLRGAFNYAAVSTDGEFRPERFAILVLHDTEGVKTLTVKAPTSVRAASVR